MMYTQEYTSGFKKIVLVALLAVLGGILISNASADGVTVTQTPLGVGTPGEMSVEDAAEVMDGMYHSPQYMPGYPTAGVIWPRVVEIPCTVDAAGKMVCDGYETTPAQGRGEYLFLKPVVKPEPKPPVCCESKPVIILQEVPAKKGRE